MITTSATYDTLKGQANLMPIWIVKIDPVSGTDWYISDKPNLTIIDGVSTKSVLPIVLSFGNIDQAVDVFSRRYSVGDITLTLDNMPWRATTSSTPYDYVRISDDFSNINIINRTILIYLLATGITDLADALLVYRGVGQPLTDINNKTCKMVIKDINEKVHLTIPQKQISTEYSGFLPDSKTRYIPIMYGTFKYDIDLFDGRSAPGVPAEELKWVFADSDIDSIDRVWVQDELAGWMAYIDAGDYTTTKDGTVTVNQYLDVGFNALIYPTITGVVETFGSVTNPDKAIDQDLTTYAEIDFDTNVTGGTVDLRCYFGQAPTENPGTVTEAVVLVRVKAYERQNPIDDFWWNFGGGDFHYEHGVSSSAGTSIQKTVGKATAGGATTLTDTNQAWTVNEWQADRYGNTWTVEILHGPGVGETKTIVSNTATILTVDSAWSTNPTAFSVYTIFGGWLEEDITAYWVAQSIDLLNFNSSDGTTQDGMIEIHLTTTNAKDYKYLDVYEVRLGVAYDSNIQYYRPAYGSITRPGVIEAKGPHNTNLFIEGGGREFGSWITDGLRSVGGFASGDLISHPVFIIEDILRTELGITTIDTDSFDNAYSIGYNQSSLIIADRQNSMRTIQDICKQYPMIFFLSAAGSARVFMFQNASYSADATIYHWQIKIDTVSVQHGDLRRLVNDVRVNYDLHPQEGKYYNFAEDDDSTSQTTYGVTNRREVNIPMIADTTEAESIADYWAGSTWGFWIDMIPTVSFEALWTMELAEVEIGDIVTFDDGLDDYLLYLNATWDAKKFLVIEKNLGIEKLTFKLMEL